MSNCNGETIRQKNIAFVYLSYWLPCTAGAAMNKSHRLATLRSRSIDHELDHEREKKAREVQLLILGKLCLVSFVPSTPTFKKLYLPVVFCCIVKRSKQVELLCHSCLIKSPLGMKRAIDCCIYIFLFSVLTTVFFLVYTFSFLSNYL